MSARVKMGRFQNAGTHTPPSRPVSRSLRRKSKVYNHASAQNVDEEGGEERRAKYGEYGEYGESSDAGRITPTTSTHPDDDERTPVLIERQTHVCTAPLEA